MAFIMLAVLFFTVALYSCCVVAGRADDASERYMRKHQNGENSNV